MLVELENNSDDIESINTIFRAAHSIKGGSGTFGLTAVADFTHVLETLLDEMRDLLKSTLIDSDVRYDLADHFIGHKPKDSYEKQDILYPETLRSEYSKASKRLNVFTNFTSFVKGFENTKELQSKKWDIVDRNSTYIS